MAFPNALHRRVAILELLHPFRSRQAVPDLNQPGCRPTGRELCQASLIAESVCVRDGFGFLDRGVHGDVVSLGFKRKDFHFYAPFRDVRRGDHIHHSGPRHKQENSAGNRGGRCCGDEVPKLAVGGS